MGIERMGIERMGIERMGIEYTNILLMVVFGHMSPPNPLTERQIFGEQYLG